MATQTVYTWIFIFSNKYIIDILMLIIYILFFKQYFFFLFLSKKSFPDEITFFFFDLFQYFTSFLKKGSCRWGKKTIKFNKLKNINNFW